MMPENNKDIKQDKQQQHEDNNNKPGLLPPQALPTPPPPPPLPTQDTSTLLSPWWSEEPPTESSTETIRQVVETSTELKSESNDYDNDKNDSLTTTTTETTTTTAPPQPKNPNLVTLSLMSYGRTSTIEGQQRWKEKCIALSVNSPISSSSSSNLQDEPDVEKLFEKTRQCRMICFLRASKQVTRDLVLKENNGKLPTTFSYNPFYGTYISVAKTPKRCKEHLLDGDIRQKTFSDYYIIELGQEISNSGEYVSKAVSKTFSPLQHLTQKYIDSWKNGNQRAFFGKFWSSVQKGDAFYLVKDSTKRLIESALGHDKNDKK